VALSSNNGALSYSTPTATLKVTLLPDMGSINSSEGVSQLVLKRGQAVKFSGASLMKDTFVQAWLPKSNSEVGRFKVGPGGAFSAEIELQTSRLSSALPIGEQTVQFTGVDESGDLVVINAPITVLQPDIAPELIMGQTPFMPKPELGKAINTEGGRISNPILELDSFDNKLSVVGTDWDLGVELIGPESLLEGDNNEFQMTLAKNEPLNYKGTGFMPGTVASIWLFSDPVKLGEVRVLEDGTFSGLSEEMMSSIPGGEHTLQIQGVRADGIVVSANLGVLLQSGPLDFLLATPLSFLSIDQDSVQSKLFYVYLVVVGVVLVFLLGRKSTSLTAKPTDAGIK